MIRLVRAELRRLTSRRMTLITAIVLLVAVALLGIGVNFAVSPPSSADVAEQRQYYEQAHHEWEQQDHDQQLQDCMSNGDSREDCESYTGEPKPEDYALTASSLVDVGDYVMVAAAVVAMLASYLVAASSIGAEYTSGALANWLTFVPRRLQVYGSKLIAVVLGSALVGAVVTFLVLGLAALLTRLHDGSLSGVDHLAAMGGRAVVLTAAAGVLGFVLALVTRHTVAAVGAVLGYLVVSTVLGGLSFNADGFFRGVPPWLAENNARAFLQHGLDYTQYRDVTAADGTNTESVERHITFGHSAVYWLVVVVVAVVGAALVFRRRDVT